MLIIRKRIKLKKNIIKELQPDMSMSEALELLKKIKETYIEIQKAWSNQDISQAEKYYSQKLFQKHQVLMSKMIQDEQRNFVKSVRIIGFYDYHKYVSNSFYITLHASLIDYTQNLATGQVISGYKYRRGTITQKLVFEVTSDRRILVKKIVPVNSIKK